MYNESIKKLWQEYLNSINENLESTEKKFTISTFGNTSEMIEKLVDLVLKNEKKATTSLYYWYEIENEKIPEIGDLTIIVDSNNIAKCIIRNKMVKILKFSDVDEEFAYVEGEGDKSLSYWRNAHINFFTKELKSVNKEFKEDMFVVCEEFEVVYKNKN